MLAYAALASFFLLARAQNACEQIEKAISSASEVSYPGQPTYFRDISHWARSSSQLSECSVQPGTTQDVGAILRIVGNSRTPFAVKGGGHTSNPGFSSTTGVQIAMSRFNQVTYDTQSQTAVIGAGLIWDDVYEALAPHNVNVLGGRVSGVGVAGFLLGGGYSWLSNQYGLAVDTITAYELVKPDGSVVTVTESSDVDLFFALKGGMNNFGIVTRFTMKTYPQGQVWGGLRTYTASHVDAISAATAKFWETVTDPKASLITTYNHVAGVDIGVSLLLFYDGPSTPAGIFDDFMSIPYLTSDMETRDFLSLVKTSPSDVTEYWSRGIFSTVPLLKITPTMLTAIVNETKWYGDKLDGALVSYDVEPFVPNLLSHASGLTAYPPTRDHVYLPLNIYYAWARESYDNEFQNAIRASTKHLESIAVAEGQAGVDAASPYPNYAIYDTPVSRVYGDNLGRLQSIRSKVDPTNVMGLAGGFRI
ncbi:hypothetical protein V5O48_008184 [Marasmius crinis-equi]|uniref:FAD-binding PCMH-type domain-containing protein n=1 Tax=Marasmius crinis-equi TaxID=585013 RepID=A0ABR3FEN0_9AGAR